MPPRPPVPPTPPQKAVRAMKIGQAVDDKEWNPVLLRYLAALGKPAFLWVGLGHLGIIILMGAFVYLFAEQGKYSPEAVLKFIGAYCFFIVTLVIPLASPLLFPDIGRLDPSFDSLPLKHIRVFDARFAATGLLCIIAALPLLPVFLAFDPLIGLRFDIFDIFPFLQAVVSGLWVHVLMESTSRTDATGDNLGRRITVIVMLVLLHIIIVGFIGQNYRVTMQKYQVLKVVADLNPFSQLYMLMAGKDENRLMLNTAFQRLIDYRLYLFMLHNFFFLPVLFIIRLLKSHADDS